MASTLRTPQIGEVKFLKKFEHDFPEPGVPPIKPASALSVSTNAYRKFSLLTSTDEIKNAVAKKLQNLVTVAAQKIALEQQLDSTLKNLEEINPKVIRQLERCLQELEQGSIVVNKGATMLRGTTSAISLVAHGVTRTLAESEALPHNVKIRLVHQNFDPNYAVEPLLHRRVEVLTQGWFRTGFGADRVTYDITDREGRFSFPYPLQAGNQEKLTLCVYEETLPEKGLTSLFGRTVRTVFTTEFIPSDQPQEFQVELYEYPPRDNNYLPRLHQPEDPRRLPQQQPISYEVYLGLASAEPLFKKTIAKFYDTVAGIENLFGVIRPGLELNSKTTAELLLRGIYPCNFLNAPPESNSKYLVDIKWDRYAKDNPQKALLPNVRVYLKDHPTDCLEVCKISIQLAGEADYLDFSPNDLNFTKALYVANSMALVKGEIVSHLGLGHLYTEQNAMAVFRNLRYSPLGLLLKPHLRGVMEINHLGDNLIFGETGILNLTGLNVQGITQALQDVLSGMDYTNFLPRQPVNNLDHFAHAETLYWTIVGETVDEFFATNGEQIQNYWYEVEAVSRNLTQQSFAHRPWEGKPYTAWVSANEIDQPEPWEALDANGFRVGQAVRPIVQTPGAAVPNPADVVRLKRFTQHAIFMATFWHWSVHKTQGDWGTNLKIASLAPRDFDEIPYRGVDPQDGAQQLSLAHVFTNFTRGPAVDNIHGDISPLLIDRIQDKKDNFAKWGFDITTMFGGVFI